jgi:hypothetical protein
MPEKRESPEGVYGAVPRGPRDKAKATLPESQSPVVERTPAATTPTAQRPRSGSSDFRDRLPPPGGAMENDSIQGDEWGAYVTFDTFSTTGTWDGLPDASPRATESS